MAIFNLAALLYNLKNGQLKAFDASNFKKIHGIDVGKDLLNTNLLASAILPNGQLICITESSLQLFDLSTKSCIKEFPFSIKKPSTDTEISDLRVLPDGNKILIAKTTRSNFHQPNNDRWIEIWDISTGHCLLETKDEGVQVLTDGQTALELYTKPSMSHMYSANRGYALAYAGNSGQLNTDGNIFTGYGNYLGGKWIPLSKTLKTIDLKLVPLDQDDILPLLEELIRCPDVMKNLSLSGIKLNETGFQCILNLIQTSTRLKSLNLKETDLTDEQQSAIGKAWGAKRYARTGLLLLNNKAVPVNNLVIGLALEPMTPTFFADFTFPHLQKVDLPLSDPPVNSRFLCPITQEIMFNPVVTSEGHTYEEEAIQQHWETTGRLTNPVTNMVVPDDRLIPNHNLRSDISEFLVKYPDYWSEVYFSKKLCSEVERTCHTNNAVKLKRLLEKDRRLLISPVMLNPTKFVLEQLCEQDTHWDTLFPLVVTMLKPEEWQVLLAHKPIEEWLKLVANVNIKKVQQGAHAHPAAFSFLTKIQATLDKRIDPVQLSLYALQQKHFPLFRLSLSLIENINQPVDIHGNTLLHLAAQQGHPKIVDYLLESGANFKQRNHDDKKPEILARENGRTETADMIATFKITPLLYRLGILDGMHNLQRQVAQLQKQIEEANSTPAIAPPPSP